MVHQEEDNRNRWQRGQLIGALSVRRRLTLSKAATRFQDWLPLNLVLVLIAKAQETSLALPQSPRLQQGKSAF